MQQDKINKKAAIAFWVLTAICMGVIFYFSSRNADQSREQSSTILDFLLKLFNLSDDSGIGMFILRKSAHMLEFTGLSLLFNCAWYFTKNKKLSVVSIICTSLYAVSDEIHQIFIEGRSCELRDWAIDTIGAIIGAMIFLIIYYLILKIKDRKNKDERISI